MNKDAQADQGKLYSAFSDALHNLEIARIMGPQTSQERADTGTSLWGLAISGGGIRSATFGLGVLQGLAHRGLLGAFHYCATVSGGGYVGGFIQSLLHHHPFELVAKLLSPDKNVRERLAERGLSSNGPISELRRFSNFITPNKRAFSGDRIAMIATYTSNTMLTFAQLAALIVLIAYAPFGAYEAIEALAKLPVVLWAMAMVFCAIALATRKGEFYEIKADQRTEVRRAPLAPLLLALTFMCLSGIVWMFPCESRLAGAGDILIWLGTISNSDWLITEKCRAFPAFSATTTYFVGFLVWLVWWIPSAKKQNQSTFGRRLGKQLLFGPIAAIGLGAAVFQLANPSIWGNSATADERALAIGRSFLFSTADERALAIGTPLLFSVFFVVNLLHLAFAYEKGDAVSRERWARLMGRCMLIIVFGLSLPITFALLIPAYLYSNQNLFAWSAYLSSVFAFITSGAGAALAYRVPKSLQSSEIADGLVRWAIQAALWLCISCLMLAAGCLAFASLYNGYALPVAITAAISWFALAELLDENEFSMNGFYRNRLVRCYLAPGRGQAARDPETGLDPEGDDILLKKLRGFATPSTEQKPLYPLLCGAVNLVGIDRLDWQDRQAASFVFSPLFCGHQPLPDSAMGPIGDSIDPPTLITPTGGTRGSDAAGEHTLGAAMSISGAALSPNMGYHSSRAGAFLLSLFNARLGWWVKNYNASAGAIRFAGDKLISELLSHTRGDSEYVYVTDGGHFENLGIYELVRRGCRFILAIDATADPERIFGDLANAVHKCRVDFDVAIDIDTSLMRCKGNGDFPLRCASLGKIAYPNGEDGILVYVKPTLLGTESADILNYAADHPAFPHEPTIDQFFDEEQFECYRELGFETALRVFEAAGRRSSAGTIGLGDISKKEKIVEALKYRLYEPSNATSQHRAHHDASLVQLFEKIRTSPGLHSLDHQLYPGLASFSDHLYKAVIGDDAERKRLSDEVTLPARRAEFRECFYFMQELIQLMEGVYLDLDLERNWNHPDNRGWMNLFRHWVWVPMFRLAWSLTLQTHGGRFVRFCEVRLDMPRFEKFIHVRWFEYSRRANGLPICFSSTEKPLGVLLQEKKRINFVEQSIIDSPAVQEALVEANSIHVAVLSFSSQNFLRSIKVQLPPMRIGVALVVEPQNGSTRLIVLRVRDHLRRLGLGISFMQKIVRRFPRLDEVKVAPGDYGHVVCRLGQRAAGRQTEQLKRLWKQAKLLEQAKITKAERRRGAVGQ